MKKLFFITTLLIFSCNSKTLSEIEKGDDEVIILSYLKIENSSKQKIYNFLENYVDKVILVEPQSYGYGFYEYGDDILFIERFKNEGAIISHAKNVSEGGVLQKDYTEYNYYFEPYKVDVFGKVSQDLIDYLKPYNLPIFYYPNIVRKFPKKFFSPNAKIKIGKTFEPKIKFFPPLKKEIIHFLECIKKRKTPITDGNYALNISKIIEGIEKQNSSGN